MRPQAGRIALASFPRSGNTWVRYMVEQATGEKTGSVYKDRIMPRDDKGVLIKTHELDSDKYDAVVHVVRNPYDAIESYYFWRIDVAGEQDVQWKAHVNDACLRWKSHLEHWLESPIPRLTVRYEDILDTPQESLKRILDWLGYDISPSVIAETIVNAKIENMRKISPLGEKFFRRGKKNCGKEAFTPEQIASIRAILGNAAASFGYIL